MSTEIALVAPSTEIIPSAGSLQTRFKLAKVLFDSGFMPETITTPQAAFAIIQKGVELGIPPMQALSLINVIKGKPVASAELILALIYRDHGDDAYIVEESTDSICRVTYKRRTWSERRAFQFTIEEAKAAGLLDAKNVNWKIRPAAMLRARCASAVGRLGFPDSIGGMRLADEMTESGGALESEVWNAPPPPPATTSAASVIDIQSREVLDGDATDPDEDPSIALPAPAVPHGRQDPQAPIGRLAPAQPPRASQAPASDRAQGDQATPAQMSRIHKLYEALGRGQVVADMTSEAAGKLIAELVTEFNARSRSSREQQAPTATFDPLPEAPTEPPTQRQLDGIAQILTLLRAFHGKDQSEGAIHSKLHAKQRLDVLMQLLRAPVPEPGLPASDEARELVLSAAADLLHAGGSAESVPAELTRSAAWVLYQRLREDLKKLTGELK